MLQKQKQLFKPILRLLIDQQQSILCCMCLKSILFLLTLNLLVQQYTNVSIKRQLIALSLILLYFFTVKYNYKGSFFTYLLQKSTKIERMFLSLLSLLILQIKYVSLLSPIICLICYGSYVIQINDNKRQKDMTQYEKNSLPISILVMIQLKLILLKYEGYIEFEWGYVVIVLFGVSVILLFMIGFLSFYFLCVTPVRTEYYEDQEQNGYYRLCIKHALFPLFSIYTGYLNFIAVFANFYLSQVAYRYFLVSVFTLAIIQMVIYFIWFHQLVILFLSFESFWPFVFVRLKNGRFMKLVDLEKKSFIIEKKHVIEICYLCEKEARVMHEVCGRLKMCYDCFKVQVCEKKRKCQICKTNGYNNNYYYIFGGRDFMLQGRETMRSYLREDEYFSVVL